MGANMGQPAVRHELTNTCTPTERTQGRDSATSRPRVGVEQATIDVHAFIVALGLFARGSEQELALHMLELLAGLMQLQQQLPLLDQQLFYFNLVLVLAVRLLLLVLMVCFHPHNICSPVHMTSEHASNRASKQARLLRM
jgi:hypothetical protein